MGRRAITKEKTLRLEIESSERMENHYREKLARIKKVGYYWLEEECIASINHYIGQRKWLIKRLVEMQMKEFDG